MKRPLTDEEKQIDTRQLEVKNKDLEKLKDSLAYNEAIIHKQEYVREFDDNWRQYLRENKDEEDSIFVKTMKDQIENIESHIDELDDHLNNGVEIKTIN
jgi:hypothetical protein